MLQEDVYKVHSAKPVCDFLDKSDDILTAKSQSYRKLVGLYGRAGETPGTPAELSLSQ